MKGPLLKIGVVIIIAFVAFNIYAPKENKQDGRQKDQSEMTAADSTPKQANEVFRQASRWVSKTDPKAGIEIKDGHWTMFYIGTEVSENDQFDFSTQTVDQNGQKIEYLKVYNTNDTLKYAVLEWTEDNLTLSYLARGNTLRYAREK